MFEPGATARGLLLPPGTWLERGTGAVHEGGHEVDLMAPLGHPVMLLRLEGGRRDELGELFPDVP